MPGRARNFRFRSCYKDGCLSTSKSKTKNKIFVFVSAHVSSPVIRSGLRLVTIAKSESRGIGFFSDFRFSKIVSGYYRKSDIGNLKFEILHEITTSIISTVTATSLESYLQLGQELTKCS